ncbi:MAG: glucose-1-phosphate thymidylyltransferase, partial [Donghicola eburneus]|nr:glucose-1-phosphate thymidylyltransferase [Donghicola eburneus]
ARGELEIVTLLESYLKEGILTVEKMGRGYAWLDTGTHGSLLDAGNFVRTLSVRQGMQSGCPEEVAYLQGWITDDHMRQHAETYKKTEYGKYLQGLIKN